MYTLYADIVVRGMWLQLVHMLVEFEPILSSGWAERRTGIIPYVSRLKSSDEPFVFEYFDLWSLGNTPTASPQGFPEVKLMS